MVLLLYPEATTVPHAHLCLAVAILILHVAVDWHHSSVQAQAATADRPRPGAQHDSVLSWPVCAPAHSNNLC